MRPLLLLGVGVLALVPELALAGGSQRAPQRYVKGRFTRPQRTPSTQALAASVDPGAKAELEQLARDHGIVEDGGLPGWATAAILHLKDPAKIRSAVALLMRELPLEASTILPFAIHFAGSPRGVQPGSEAAWRAALAGGPTE